MGGAWQAPAVLGLQVHAITSALGEGNVGSNNQKVFLHIKSSPWSFDLFFTKKNSGEMIPFKYVF